MTTSNANPLDDVMADESAGNDSHDEARLDAVFGVLSDARRRRTIRILRTNGRETTPVDALAESLADREPGEPSLDSLRDSMRHIHLPKLADAGVVDYAPEQSRVRYRDAPLVESVLDQL